MNIIIINICINWVYRLYEEYILSIKKFIDKNYTDININILYYDSTLFEINLINNIDLLKYDKIFYTGDLSILNEIIKLTNNNFKKIYFINIEQMSHPSYYTYIRNIDNNINIIDYSEENIPFYKSIYNNIFLFPPYYEYSNNNILDKNIDIMTIINNNYRKNIINNIDINKKYKLLFIDNCYGKERDDYFYKTKIYINIHCSELHNTMELIRIVNLIMNKVIVITSNSIYSDLLYIKDYIIICNNTSDLSNLINEILKNYNYYYNKIFNNFNNEKYLLYIKKNLDLIIYN
jgi:hypothetical protein